MNFLVEKSSGTIVIKSDFPIDQIVKLPSNWRNNFILLEKETTFQEIDSRGGVFFLNGQIVFGDSVPLKFRGKPVTSKLDVDKITNERLAELFAAYGGEEKFKTELSLYVSDLITNDEKVALREKLDPVVKVRKQIIDEGNDFIKRNRLN